MPARIPDAFASAGPNLPGPMFRTPDLQAQNRRLKTELDALKTELAHAREETKRAKARAPETVDVWVLGIVSYLSLAIAWATLEEEFLYLTAASAAILVVNGFAKLYAKRVASMSVRAVRCANRPDPPFAPPASNPNKRDALNPTPENGSVISRVVRAGSATSFDDVVVDERALTLQGRAQLVQFAMHFEDEAEIPVGKFLPYGSLVRFRVDNRPIRGVGQVISWQPRIDAQGKYWVQIAHPSST